jgi:hypothetical protein
MQLRRPHVCLLLLVLMAATGAEPTPAESTLLTVQPATGKPLELTAEQWNALPHVSVTTAEHGGERASFDGVPVAEVLRLAGAPAGAELRGQNLRYYIVARAADGYEVVFALAEFDPAFSERVIVIADRRNGQAIGANEGPLRFVVPGDKRQARWIRQLQTITIRTAP